MSKRTTSIAPLGQFQFPPAVEFANLPTPLVPLEQLSKEIGHELHCKRDDLTEAALTGNKIRKLEFLLAAALDAGAEGVVTCGGAQSNHARATALAAARLGLRSKLLLRTTDPEHPPALEGNVLLDRLAGAEIRWISPEQYAAREALLAKEVEASNNTLYAIPEGGSNALGAVGYIRCAEELGEQLGQVPATIVCAVGSGGTAAGLIAGCRLFDLPYRVIGICVADDKPTFQGRIAGICHELAQRFHVDVAIDPEGVEVWDGYVGRGYALSQPEELATIVRVARSEGLVLDPVYTGKAMYGLLTELEKGRELAEPIVFLHTGGIFGLFDQTEALRALLD